YVRHQQESKDSEMRWALASQALAFSVVTPPAWAMVWVKVRSLTAYSAASCAPRVATEHSHPAIRIRPEERTRIRATSEILYSWLHPLDYGVRASRKDLRSARDPLL